MFFIDKELGGDLHSRLLALSAPISGCDIRDNAFAVSVSPHMRSPMRKGELRLV
jgi:hypothetical protein